MTPMPSTARGRRLLDELVIGEWTDPRQRVSIAAGDLVHAIDAIEAEARAALAYGPCPTRLENQPTPSTRPWRYGHAASIEGAHWDIYAGEGIDGWLVGMVTTEADAALIVGAVNGQPSEEVGRE